MNVLIGLAGIVGVIFYVLTNDHGAFTGMIHIPSVILLSTAPLFMALVAYRPRELLRAVQELRRALRFDPLRARAELFDGLTRFAAELRARRQGVALEISDQASNPLFRELAPLVIRQYSTDDIERTSTTALYVRLSAMRRSEDVFHTLARVAPATGLIGTVLGLIALLKDLSRFDQLGPSMALALLCTLYGLLLANALYQPLARQIRNHSTAIAEDAKLLTRGLVLTAEGKPLADVRKLFDVSPAAPPPPVASGGLALGGEG